MVKRLPYSDQVKTPPAQRPVLGVKQERERYRAKGSPQPIVGKCGAKLAKRHGVGSETPWRYCTQLPLKGKTKCRVHGGLSLGGIAHPNYTNGRSTNPFTVGSSLAQGYDSLRGDDDYLTVKEEMRLLRARQRQCVDRIAAGDGESVGAWRRVRSLATEIRALLTGATPTQETIAALVKAATALVSVSQGSVAEDAFVELREIAGIWGKLSETEAKLLERNHAVLNVEQYMAMAQAIGSLAARCITQQTQLREFVNGMRALMGGLDRRQLTAGGEG